MLCSGLIGLIWRVSVRWEFTRYSGVCVTETTLKLTILDAGTQEPTPARVDVVDAAGRCYIAENALLMGGD